MIDSKAKERRKNPRFPTRVAVFQRDDMKDLSGMQYCYTKDISLGGLAVDVENVRKDWAKGLKPGKTMMSIEFILPGHPSSIRAATRLSWLINEKSEPKRGKSFTMGLEFMSILKRDREKVGEFIERSMKKRAKSRKETAQ